MRENQQIIVFSKDCRIVSWFLQQSVYFRIRARKINENIPTKRNNLEPRIRSGQLMSKSKWIGIKKLINDRFIDHFQVIISYVFSIPICYCDAI